MYALGLISYSLSILLSLVPLLLEAGISFWIYYSLHCSVTTSTYCIHTTIVIERTKRKSKLHWRIQYTYTFFLLTVIMKPSRLLYRCDRNVIHDCVVCISSLFLSRVLSGDDPPSSIVRFIVDESRENDRSLVFTRDYASCKILVRKRGFVTNER